jgi:NADH dehydrogenase
MADHMALQINRRLAGQALRPYRYQDFGSLVSLGRYSTVGNLMGFVAGRGMFIEGLFARLVYRSLYKMHEAALQGAPTVIWRTLAGALTRGPTPSVKLH